MPAGALHKPGEAAELLGWGRNTLTRKLKVLLPALADGE
ncbi:helix-turn-helix domain-containing protein [Halomonas mongoliensis]